MAPPAPKRPRLQAPQQPTLPGVEAAAQQQLVPNQQILLSEQNIKFLKLNNTGTDCFLISALNFLHASMTLIEWIGSMDFSNSEAFLRRLQKSLNGKFFDVCLLRKKLGGDLSNTELEHDLFEAVDEILLNPLIDPHVLEAHQHVSIQKWVCTNDSCGWAANVENVLKLVAVSFVFMSFFKTRI